MKINPKCPYIPDHIYIILITGGCGWGKANALLNFINYQSYINKKYLYSKDSYEAKYEFLINKFEKVGTKHYNNPRVFIEYSNDMQDAYKNIEECSPEKNVKY